MFKGDVEDDVALGFFHPYWYRVLTLGAYKEHQMVKIPGADHYGVPHNHIAVLGRKTSTNIIIIIIHIGSSL